MDPTLAAIEVAAVRWEQWIGATLRAECMRALKAPAGARRRPARPAPKRPRTRRSLLWMLAVSGAGYWLLR